MPLIKLPDSPDDFSPERMPRGPGSQKKSAIDELHTGRITKSRRDPRPYDGWVVGGSEQEPWLLDALRYKSQHQVYR